MQEKKVVTCFLEYKGKILLLKRSSGVGTYQGHWAGVAGYIEGQRSALEQALIEIHEETGLALEAVNLLKSGEILPVEDPALDTCWLVHPLRFDISSLNGFRLDWEHSESGWFDAGEMKNLPTVPGLFEAWKRVR